MGSFWFKVFGFFGSFGFCLFSVFTFLVGSHLAFDLSTILLSVFSLFFY